MATQYPGRGTPPPGTVAVQHGNQTAWVTPEQANAHNQAQYDLAKSYETASPTGVNPFLPDKPPAKFDVPSDSPNPFADIDFDALGGGGGGGGYEFSPFEYAAFQGGPVSPGAFSYGQFSSEAWNAPELQESLGQFSGPGAFEGPGAFKAPTMADIANDPGYQFRLKAGQDALERSAAARGTLLTGGTAKDLAGYQQELASQEYDKIYGRASSEYDREYNRQFGEYQTEYNRQFGEWNAESQRRMQENQQLWDRSLQSYQLNYNRLFGEHQQNYGQARDAYGFQQQNMLNQYNARLQEYQMGYQHAKDNWSGEQSAAQSAAAQSAASSERARQEQIDLLMRMAGL